MTYLLALLIGKGMGMVIALPVVAIILAVRVSRDRFAMTGIKALFTRGMGR